MEKILATHERDWDTESILVLDNDYYYKRENGGRQGAYDRQRGDGHWDNSPIEVREVSLKEARTILLGFGLPLSAVAELTR